jgi:hypothetical protein
MSYANNAPSGAITAPRRRLRTSAGALAVTVAAAAVIVTGVVVTNATDNAPAPSAVTIADSDRPTRAHPTGGGGHALNQGPKTVEGLNGKKLVPGS